MIEFVLVAALMLRDPPGDAVGAGSLVPPSAEQYRNVGSFDLLEITVLDAATLAVDIEMGALPNPAGLTNGFSNAVIDVYFDLADGGTEALLPGPEMRMPAGRGWELALRITGDGATAYRSDADPTSGPTVSYPVRVQAQERVIRVETPFERTEVLGVYALTGVYDPFVASGWRPLAEAPSPWSFSGSDQRRPVVDLLAPDAVAQAEAIRSGVLPQMRQRVGGQVWMLLMGLGVAVAGLGLVLRRMVQPARGAQSSASATEPPKPRVQTRGLGAGKPVAAAPEPSAQVASVLPVFLPALPPPRDPTPAPTEDVESTSHTSKSKPMETAGRTKDGQPAEHEDQPEDESQDAFAASASWMDGRGAPPTEAGWEEEDDFSAFETSDASESDADTDNGSDASLDTDTEKRT